MIPSILEQIQAARGEMERAVALARPHPRVTQLRALFPGGRPFTTSEAASGVGASQETTMSFLRRLEFQGAVERRGSRPTGGQFKQRESLWVVL